MMADKAKNGGPAELNELNRVTSTGEMLAHARRQSDRYGFDDTLIIDVDAHHF
jgi:hypothetical protein